MYAVSLVNQLVAFFIFTFWIGTPAYVARIRDGQFPRVLRNLHLPAIALNSIVMLLVLAVVPLDVILSGANVLSALGQMVSQILLAFLCCSRYGLKASGMWLRIFVVVDAVIVLCGGVLTGAIAFTLEVEKVDSWTGILATCELFGQLAQDRALPKAFLKLLPVTGAPYVSIFVFTGLCAVLYASAAGRLDVVSQMSVRFACICFFLENG